MLTKQRTRKFKVEFEVEETYLSSHFPKLNKRKLTEAVVKLLGKPDDIKCSNIKVKEVR